MELKSVEKEEMQRSKRPKSREVIALLEEFVASDEDVMEVCFDNSEDARKIIRNMYQLTYQHKLPISVHQRADKVYLERKKDGESEQR